MFFSSVFNFFDINLPIVGKTIIFYYYSLIRAHKHICIHMFGVEHILLEVLDGIEDELNHKKYTNKKTYMV